MKASSRLVLAALILCAVAAFAFPATAWAAGEKGPHIGYVYPAGGQQGSTLVVAVGGQFLQGVRDVCVSGEGVHAKIVQYCRPIRNLKAEQRDAIRQKIAEVTEKRQAEAAGANSAPDTAAAQAAASADTKPAADTGTAPATTDAAAAQQALIPNHPLLYDLDNMSLRQLEHVKHEILNISKKRQQNAQIAEAAIIEVTIDAEAASGERELRLLTSKGLTNPMCFEVAQLPEVRELEPNDPDASFAKSKDAPFDLPIIVNGQIMPGDVDRFRFNARKDQRLVVEAQARALVPYLADAVPGWFQATLALYDDRGREVAYDDDYSFDPDPVLFYKIPKDGIYSLEIRDSVYRGREDFVYRISVAEQPFVTAIFPLGAHEGTETKTSISGWNLDGSSLAFNTQPGADCVRQTVMRLDNGSSNPICYEVDSLPECEEKEPNNNADAAQELALPQIINGRIQEPGDVDAFRFTGKAGDEVVAEVSARRLHSPLDSLLRLTDASGTVIEWNDDHESKESGLLTHHADSYLCAKLLADGVYVVTVSDSQSQGGKAYAYRLRIGPPQPDFALRVTPSSINVPAGRSAVVCVNVLRKDGFNGEIALSLKDALAGFTLDGARIPAGRERVRMTLSAPQGPFDTPAVPLHIEGSAQINGQTVTRPAVPAEDMMQAFIYQHLVPSQELMVAVPDAKKKGGGPLVTLADATPVRLAPGGTAQVQIKAPKSSVLKDVELVLTEPPQGVTLQDSALTPDGASFTLKADEKLAEVGLADNLIVEAFTERPAGKPGTKQAEQKVRVSLGVLPAIEFEIVQK